MTTERLVCEWCGEGFDRPHKKGPTPRYCRPAHRQAAFRQRNGGSDRPHISVEVIGKVEDDQFVAFYTEAIDDDEAIEEIIASVVARWTSRGKTAPVVVILDPDETVKLLDEDAMADLGWVRRG